MEEAQQKLLKQEQEMKLKKKRIDACKSHIEKLQEQINQAKEIRSTAIKDVAAMQSTVSP